MEKTIVDFVKVLRTAEVKVSPAETLDVMAGIEFVGYEDRALFKNTLSMLLAKNPEEKETFETCFEKFFTFDDVMKRLALAATRMTHKTATPLRMKIRAITPKGNRAARARARAQVMRLRPPMRRTTMRRTTMRRPRNPPRPWGNCSCKGAEAT